MARVALAYLALVCLCSARFAASENAPIAAWSSSPFLTDVTSDEVAPAAQALKDLFTAATGAQDGGANAAPAPVEVVVVVAGGAEKAQPVVEQTVAALVGSAASSLVLPNAQQEGAGHPVFAALRSAAPSSPLAVLGDCGGAWLPSAAPATLEAVQQQVAESAAAVAGGAAGPAFVVACAASESDADGVAEAALVEAAAAAAAAADPARWLLVHVRSAQAPLSAQQRRRLAAVAAGVGDAANRTSNYTVCDATCRKHVAWFEGIIIGVVILIALVVGCCCMHLVDVPTRFAQPSDARRDHAD